MEGKGWKENVEAKQTNRRRQKRMMIIGRTKRNKEIQRRSTCVSERRGSCSPPKHHPKGKHVLRLLHRCLPQQIGSHCSRRRAGRMPRLQLWLGTEPR